MRRGDQNRHQVAPRSDKRQSSYALLVRELSMGRFFDEMGRFSALPRRLRTLQSTAPASKNEGSAYRAARRVARTMLPRKTMKIDCKIAPKSIEVGRSGDVEAPKSIEVGRSGSVEAPKSIEVGRSRWPARPTSATKARAREAEALGAARSSQPGRPSTTRSQESNAR